MPTPDPRTGVLQHDIERATPGYTLFTPLGMYKTYLINMTGEVVHLWNLPNDRCTSIDFTNTFQSLYVLQRIVRVPRIIIPSDN